MAGGIDDLAERNDRSRRIGRPTRPDQPSMWEMNVEAIVTRPAPGRTLAP